MSIHEQCGVSFDRHPIGVTDLPGSGILVMCCDGAMFASFPKGDEQRVWSEGTPIPGSSRSQEADAIEAERAREKALRDAASNWQAVARNLAQSLNAAAEEYEDQEELREWWITGSEEKRAEIRELHAKRDWPGTLRGAFARQCEAHGITP